MPDNIIVAVVIVLMLLSGIAIGWFGRDTWDLWKATRQDREEPRWIIIDASSLPTVHREDSNDD